MRFSLLFFFISFINASIFSQSVEEFIHSYNAHVDPLRKLDTIAHITIKWRTQINSYLTGRRIESSATCYHCTNGKEICIKEKDLPASNLDLVSIPASANNKNLIKYMVNWIFVEESGNEYTYKVINDSITVVEELTGLTNRKVYTFDTQSLNLLQIRAITSTGVEETVRDTNFLHYDMINGILVPRKISYLSNICDATIEYLDISFEPFSQSVFGD